MFRLSLTAFPRLGGGNSAGKPVPADPGAPVAAVLTDDDDGDHVKFTVATSAASG